MWKNLQYEKAELRKVGDNMQTSTSWRSFRMAAWLGWVIESNWTDPFLFAVYSIVKPLSGAAILVIMYGVITQGAYDSALFPYIYLGNAFYIYVGAVMTGVSWAVVDDRELYKTLKYMYIAPINRSEEHTSELQSQSNLVCRLLLEKKKKKKHNKNKLTNKHNDY